MAGAIHLHYLTPVSVVLADGYTFLIVGQYIKLKKSTITLLQQILISLEPHLTLHGTLYAYKILI